MSPLCSRAEISDQRKAYARPLVRACRCAFDAVEALEHARNLFSRNAWTTVLHNELDVVSKVVQRPRTEPCNVNFSALERRFSTIFSHMSGAHVRSVA